MSRNEIQHSCSISKQWCRGISYGCLIVCLACLLTGCSPREIDTPTWRAIHTALEDVAIDIPQAGSPRYLATYSGFTAGYVVLKIAMHEDALGAWLQSLQIGKARLTACDEEQFAQFRNDLLSLFGPSGISSDWTVTPPLGRLWATIGQLPQKSDAYRQWTLSLFLNEYADSQYDAYLQFTLIWD